MAEIKTIMMVSVGALIAGVLGFIFLSIIFGVGAPVVTNSSYKSDFGQAVTVLTYLPEIIVVVLLVVVLGLVYRAFD